ncbi:phospholipase A2-like [Peromyscus eremicus]|uniref:phospholipase A2-like n=1 Tax=Peromyscus eremicus TaxID=42410 RepID=UPI0027DB1AF0|nr:phospholipase A2-like [Peromyscus eremicus]
MLCILVAGATAQSISPQALTQFNNVIKCTIPGSDLLVEFDHSGSFCGFGDSDTSVNLLDMCCQTHDNCYGQAMKMESCKFLIDNPYSSSYSYTCSKNVVTCSDKNNPCEDFICNCDREAAICFLLALYNIEYKGVHF